MMRKTKKQLEEEIKQLKKEKEEYENLFFTYAWGKQSDKKRNANFCESKEEAELMTADEMSQLIFNEVTRWGIDNDLDHCYVKEQPDLMTKNHDGFVIRFGRSLFKVKVEKYRRELEGGAFYDIED